MEQLFVIAQNYVQVLMLLCFSSFNMISVWSATTFLFSVFRFLHKFLAWTNCFTIYFLKPAVSKKHSNSSKARRQKMCNTSKIFKWRYAVNYWPVNSFLFGIYKMTFTFSVFISWANESPVNRSNFSKAIYSFPWHDSEQFRCLRFFSASATSFSL